MPDTESTKLISLWEGDARWEGVGHGGQRSEENSAHIRVCEDGNLKLMNSNLDRKDTVHCRAQGTHGRNAS